MNEFTRDRSASPEREAFIQKIESLHWFHQIDLGDGIISPGRAKLADLKLQADAFFSGISLAGRSVLDVGCYNGFYSFEAHKRGARRVLATDHFIWHRHRRSREAFDIAHARVAPQVEVMDIDVFDLTPAAVGRFDVVLFCGVFYHLRNPFLALERVAKLVNEVLVVETRLDAAEIERPAMVFYPGAELNNDPSNWWGPNRACVEAMLRDVGFNSITAAPNPAHPAHRMVFQARF